MDINTIEPLPALANEPNLIERFKQDVELAGLVAEPGQCGFSRACLQPSSAGRNRSARPTS